MVRKINLISVFICFAVPWLAFFLLLSLIKGISFHSEEFFLLKTLSMQLQDRIFWLNLIPSAVLFGIGIGVNILINHNQDCAIKIKSYRTIIIVGFLIAVDQMVQLLMVNYHELIHAQIIENWLEINPLLVIQSGDKFVSTAQLSTPIRLVMLFIAALAGFVVFYSLNRVYLDKSHFYWSVIFCQAGFLCALFNALFYQNGYDYIDMRPHVVYDIKDIYIYLGVALFFQSVMVKENYQALKNVTWYDIWKYLVHKLKGIRGIGK